MRRRSKRAGRLASEQLAVSPHGIGIGDHRIERDVFARLRLDSPDTAVARLENSPHSRSGPDLDAQLGRESGQCPRHGPCASQGIPDSLAGLHVGDAAKYRGRCVRSRAHVLGEMIEHLGNTRVRARASAPSRPPTALGSRRGGRASRDGSKVVLTLNMSRRPPTGRQKKKRSETWCNRAECSMKRR